MKTMTCKQLGGPCDTKITAPDKQAMLMAGMQHVEAAHPEMAADIKAMAKDDPKMVEWQAQFDKAWDETPEDQEEQKAA